MIDSDSKSGNKLFGFAIHIFKNAFRRNSRIAPHLGDYREQIFAEENPAKQEHDRTLIANRQRYLIFPKAVSLGLVAGGVAVAFHILLDAGDELRDHLIDQARQWGYEGFGIVLVFAVVSVIIASLLVKTVSPEAAGSGIPHVKAMLIGGKSFNWLRVLLVKFASGLIGISGGLALGREGPTVQMGAALGMGLSKLPTTRHYEQPALIAAGGGAGLAAAFNSPLAGVVFVLEELQGKFASLEFFAAALACLTADMVCRAVLGPYPVFHVSVPQEPELLLLLAFMPLGFMSGFLGVVFNRSLLATQYWAKSSRFSQLTIWLCCGVALAVTGWYEPALLGGGQSFLQGFFSQGLALASVPIFICTRFVLTIGSYATGAAGGIFSPVLVIGALLGLYVENIVSMFFPELNLVPNTFAVVGMAAYFTGVVRAPLTAIVLMIEMTGNYGLILPLFIACFSALLIADGMNDLPIYEALLVRDLKKKDTRVHLGESAAQHRQ